jgi:hypothetical protein
MFYKASIPRRKKDIKAWLTVLPAFAFLFFRHLLSDGTEVSGGGSFLRAVRIGSRLEVYGLLPLAGGTRGSDGQYRLRPVLTAAGRRLELPCVVVSGWRRYLALSGYLRRHREEGLEASYGIYRSVVRPLRAGVLRYRHGLAYEPWMAGARVEVFRSG